MFGIRGLERENGGWATSKEATWNRVLHCNANLRTSSLAQHLATVNYTLAFQKVSTEKR